MCLQEQYQYLYQAMLSLISSRDSGLSPMYMDTNGVVVIMDESDPTESMESLVWQNTHLHPHLICTISRTLEDFPEAFFRQNLG